ncbi:MAG: CDP-diacylglycerol--glycerol-3-phosphate 3-phosphatidyltransferase [Clostridia bacterium]
MNLPTKITVSRILLIPIMIAVYCCKSVFDYYYIVATAIFVLASCTDFIDGHIARSRNMVTDLGKFLDPIADKILVVVGMIMLMGMQVLPDYFGVITISIILSREFIIGVFRQIAASKGCVLAADKLGKAKTIVTCTAIPMLMLAPLAAPSIKIVAIHYIGLVFYWGGLALFLIATLLTVVSGINYILKNKTVLQDKKES